MRSQQTKKLWKQILEYAEAYHPEGVYPLGYMSHNNNFLWYSAAIAGQEKIALRAATTAASQIETSLIREPGFAGTLSMITLYFRCTPQSGWVDRNEIVSTKSPDADLTYPVGVWHFARGMAFAESENRLTKAEQELETLKAYAGDSTLEGVKVCGRADAADLLSIAATVLAGKIAERQENYSEAIASFVRGLRLKIASLTQSLLLGTDPFDRY